MKYNDLTKIIGLRPATGLTKDGLFLSMLLIGMPVAWVLASTGFVGFPKDNKLMIYLSVLFWFPLFEELTFRGLIQGVWTRGASEGGRWLGITRANLLTSMAFVGWHLMYQTAFFVLVLIVPSLVFGFFRDRYDSVVPSLMLHVGYNGFLLLAVELTG